MISRFILPLRFFALAAVACTLSGCPRGETHTLSEIIATAKGEFAAQSLAVAPGDLQAELQDVSQRLLALADRKTSLDVKAESARIADTLSTIVLRAGFTARPGMSELQQQFRVMGEGGARSERIRDAAALLAARTLSAFAAELRSTRFSI